MVTGYNHNKVKGYKIKFSGDKGTSFGGLVLVERLAKRLGLWKTLERSLPRRRGHYDWMTILKSSMMGLLTGSRGTYAAEELRSDQALLNMLGLGGAPEEVTFWRSLGDLGQKELLDHLGRVQRQWVVKLARRTGINRMLRKGFVPVFGDGTLLEGSKNREGTKVVEEKGRGLLWTTMFVGPFQASQHMTKKGEGELTAVRRMLPEVVEKVLVPLKMKKRALVLMDSLYGDGPTLRQVEGENLKYVIGANKLTTTKRTLRELSEVQWTASGPDARRRWAESWICVCWLQCDGWKKKRLLVGRRYRREGELTIWYSGVVTNLGEEDVKHLMTRGRSYAEVIWDLYDMKMGMENYYKDLLDDLNLHHPPCREYVRNAGFYSLASLAYTLILGAELIGGKGRGRGETRRKDGKKRRRRTPERMRIWRFIRRLIMLPARISYHSRQILVSFLGGSPDTAGEFMKYWENILRC